MPGSQAGHRRAGASQVTPSLASVPVEVSRLKDPDAGTSQGVPFPGSGVGQGEAEEEDAACAAKASLEVGTGLIYAPSPPCTPPSFHTYHGAPLMHPTGLHTHKSPQFAPSPVCSWMDTGVFGPWSTPRTPSAEQHQPGGLLWGPWGAPSGHWQPCYPGVPPPPPPPLAPLRHPHEFLGSL